MRLSKNRWGLSFFEKKVLENEDLLVSVCIFSNLREIFDFETDIFPRILHIIHFMHGPQRLIDPTG